MREDIINDLQREIKTRCDAPSNAFGSGVFQHIQAVARNGALLAGQWNADLEAVIIACWLHDIASITDKRLYEEHHIHGAVMAKEILDSFHYPPEKIELVQQCIRNHRGSAPRAKMTVEERCVADADAISHFDAVPSLLYLAFVQRNMSLADGTAFVRDKLDRSFRKLSPQSQALYADKYDHAMELLTVI